MQRRPARISGLTNDDSTTVERALTGPTLGSRVRERLEMVKGAALGWTVAEIVTWSGRGEKTVRHWIAAYQSGGIAALADAPRPGRPEKADAVYLAALAIAVETDPRTLGQPFDVWTSRRLSLYLAETQGVQIAPGWLRVLLHYQRFANGRPKHTLSHLQDPDAVAACAERIREVGGKGGR